MPPKKKARLPSRAASTLSAETPAETHPVAGDSGTPAKGDESASKDILADPWNDEQEISLFKGMIKWKPVGMHKHFRVLSISQHLRNHGHNPNENPHTRIPGIWKKLDSLYNMSVLDEREDSLVELGYDENDPKKEPFVPFKLPISEFGDLMFERRLAHPGSSSPSSPHQLSSKSVDGRSRPSVIDDSEEPRSSPASNRGAKSTRGRRGIRRSQLHEESTPTGRSASKASVDASGDGGDAEEEDDGDENDSEEEDAPSTPARGGRGGRGGYRPGRGGRGGRWRGGRRGGRRR